jgi:hypothetical protein
LDQEVEVEEPVKLAKLIMQEFLEEAEEELSI